MKNMLFGEKFQSMLTPMVEKEMALAKAVSTKRHKKEKSSPPNKMTGQQTVHAFFVERAPLANQTYSRRDQLLLGSSPFGTVK